MRLINKLIVAIVFASQCGWAEEITFGRMLKSSPVDETFQVILQLGVTTYSNAAGTITVTLVPMRHYGEQSFYQSVAGLLEKQDQVLYEGIRLVGFFGPPFGDDPTLATPEDFLERTEARLYSIGHMIEDFERSQKRPPATWTELLGSHADFYIKTMLFDAWGNPFILDQKADGSLDIASRGLRTRDVNTEIRLSRLPKRHAQFVSRLFSSYIEFASSIERQAELQAQPPFAAYARPGGVNIDVSGEQLVNVPLWRAWQLPALWRARDRFPIEQAKAILAKLDSTEQKNIAIVYGADHAPDFHRMLVDQAGFHVVEQEWLKIIGANVNNGKTPTKRDAIRMQLIIRTGQRLLKQKTCEDVLIASR